MRAAPALDAVLDEARPERALLVALHVLAGLVLLVWAGLLTSQDIRGVGELVVCFAVVLVCALLGWLLARSALPPRGGRILWTGQRWILREEGDLDLLRVHLAIDLGTWLLLRLQSTKKSMPCWRIARRSTAGPVWHALRVALHAHSGVNKANDESGAGALQ